MYLPLVAEAANIRDGDNSAYTSTDFFVMYPQFESVVPEKVIKSFIDLAHTCVKETRFKGMWYVAMGYFIAHFCTMWLESTADAGSSAATVINAANIRGVITSESADGLSYSKDISAITQDLAGWAQFKLTTYGSQFASIAKLLGKGGMYVW